MQKENVIRLRDALKGQVPNAQLEVICDNVMFFKEPNDILDWDDENGVLRVIKTNEDHHHTTNSAFQIWTVEYEIIQYINLDCGKKSIERICNELGFSADNIEKAKEFVIKATTIQL